MRWVLDGTITIDEEKENICCIDDKEYHLRHQCWLFLLELMKANIHNQDKTLTYPAIGSALWPGDGWSDDKKETFKKVLSATVNIIGNDYIKNKSKIGYYLTKEVSAFNSSSLDKIKYYESIWEKHYKGTLRDHFATGGVRDLIDFYVSPSFTNKQGKHIETPFKRDKFSYLVIAGSGFGKTTLLHIILLCSLIDEQTLKESTVISNAIKEKKVLYNSIKKTLFGKCEVNNFPVYIDSDKANTEKYSSLLDLAEGHEIESFNDMVNEANDNGSLLFLIDSIDEVDSVKFDTYYQSIKKLLSDYKNARVVLTSRFVKKQIMLRDHSLISIDSLSISDVKQIASAMLSSEKAQEFYELLEKNEYLRSLATNPFMLVTILESKREYELIYILESVVNAIINLRWDKHNYDISSEEIKLLLGFLACSFVFMDKNSADISEIRQFFYNAGDNLKLNGVSYDFAKNDIEYFLKTLSSQSGILNVITDQHSVKYVFQDDLVKCWLAANYINKIISESENMKPRGGTEQAWVNMNEIDKIVCSISNMPTLSRLSVFVLVMSLIMCSGGIGRVVQRGFLFYLLCKDAISMDENEQMSIAKGYDILVNNYFGDNEITNNSNSDIRSIKRMLNIRNNTSNIQ